MVGTRAFYAKIKKISQKKEAYYHKMIRQSMVYILLLLYIFHRSQPKKVDLSCCYSVSRGCHDSLHVSCALLRQEKADSQEL